MNRRLIYVLISLFSALSSYALEIEGVRVPSNAEVGGQLLHLNGAGLRTFTLLTIPIKIYVAAFYTVTPVRTAVSVLDSSQPMQFDFTFLRGVAQRDVTRAWTSQFTQSVTYTYSGDSKDRSVFIGMFGPISKTGVERVQFIGTNTIVYDSGRMKGIIAGRDFQKAFLSLWFGANPVSCDLKSQLLGKDDVRTLDPELITRISTGNHIAYSCKEK